MDNNSLEEGQCTQRNAKPSCEKETMNTNKVKRKERGVAENNAEVPKRTVYVSCL